jgi:hypothetical protein
MPKTPKQYAAQLLDRLISLDQQVHGAFYEMGQILSAIAHGKLYDILGYVSTGHLIEEELSFSNSQGYRYLHTFRHFKRLGYNKTEALDLINEFSFSHMSRYLPTANQKVGKRAVGNAIEKQIEQAKQINFQLKKKDLDLLKRVLISLGAEDREGRLLHSSEALMALAREYDRRPKLKAVS